ncbi:hypothetical protein DL93DRAFT_2066780 [Clavulina sp. PMI_390]|nr:hypothetical protein DL93DRAFT_2066780 [Clavulina sp. PMI_390]
MSHESSTRNDVNIRRLSSAKEEAQEEIRPTLGGDEDDRPSSQSGDGNGEDLEKNTTVSPPGEPAPPAAVRPPQHSHPFSPHVIAILAPFAMFGLLARLGLEALTNYNGKSVFVLAWVQGVGCLFMGLAAGLREPISQFYAPLYFAIATGFCGSLTTFSSWNLYVFLAWENAFSYHRIWLYDIIDALTQLFITLAVSLSALGLGLHFAELILPYIPDKLPPPPARFSRISLSLLSIASYILAIVLYFVLPHRYRAQATAALLFSYPGALARHIASIKLNPRRKSFPLGTFAVNITGTLLIGMFYTLQRAHYSSHAVVGPLSCVMLQALMDGLCGCLTTVSTLAVEIRALKVKAWAYLGASVGLGQLVLVLVVGVPWWSGAVKEGAMCSFET